MGRQQDSLTREERLRVAKGRPANDTNGRDSRQIKRDIDRTRGAMDETLEELGERLNPRNLLDDVIDAFRSPKGREVSQRAASGASDFATNLGRQVRDNPIGASLIGAGLAWLALGSRRDDRDDDFDRDPIPRRRAIQDDFLVDDYDDDPGYYTEEDLILERTYNPDPKGAEIVVPETYGDNDDSTMDRIKANVSKAASTTGDKASSAWQSAKEGATSAANSVSDTASSIGETISDAASSAADSVKSAASSVAGAVSSAGESTSDAARRAYLRSRAAGRNAYRGTARYGNRANRRVRSGAQQTGEQLSIAAEQTQQRIRKAHDETPLALGLGVMALGAIVGALIPRTRREDELMGEASDQAIREAQAAAQNVAADVQQRAKSVVETAKQSAESQGLTADSLAQRATNVVEKASQSIADAAKEEGLHPNQLKDDAKSVAEETKEEAKAEAKDAKAKAKDKASEVDSDADKAMQS